MTPTEINAIQFQVVNHVFATSEEFGVTLSAEGTTVELARGKIDLFLIAMQKRGWGPRIEPPKGQT
jgi:hypothetical protein